MVKVRLTTQDGITLELDADAAEYPFVLKETLGLLRQAGSPAPALEREPGAQAPSDRQRPSSGVTKATMRRLVDRLADDTITYLRLLAQHPAGLDDHEIMLLMGFGNRRRLAGMNAAITKVARDVGVDEDIIESTATRGTDGSRTYHYVLSQPARDTLPEVLPPAPEEADPWEVDARAVPSGDEIETEIPF